MRALLQRVTGASVAVGDEVVGAIGPGLLILACAMRGDEAPAARRLAGKAAKLRVFRDEAGRMNRSLIDAGGAALVVSQFTLAADLSGGNRPGFAAAASPDEGRALVDAFAAELAALGVAVERGRFGADMRVSLVNDGPVTIWMEG